MRVISGKYKRLNLKGYDIEGIRPTMDKVKESIFAMIQNEIKDSIFLDLFSGTGSIGIEALSNYAKYVYFVDEKDSSIKVIKDNLSKTNENNYEIIKKDFDLALKTFSLNSIKFDIIFLDPPYGKIKIKKVIDKILKYNILNDNAIIICEYEDELLEDSTYDLELIKYRKYGKTHISIYKKR